MISGILNIKKEPGFTSHDVVAKLRGIVHQKKIGHTGTLDPDAEGVLPVALGKATRLVDMIRMRPEYFQCVLERQPSFVTLSEIGIKRMKLFFCLEEKPIPKIQADRH